MCQTNPLKEKGKRVGMVPEARPVPKLKPKMGKAGVIRVQSRLPLALTKRAPARVGQGRNVVEAEQGQLALVHPKRGEPGIVGDAC